MAGPAHVFIVCSPRARVGKTLVARLICEFYRASGRPVEAFDLEPFEPGLSEFLPRLATRVSLANTRGEMALFDRLVADDDAGKVVDLGHLALEKFFSVAADIDLATETRRRGISTLVMYIADQTTTTLNTYRILRERFPALVFVPVYNDAFARGPELRRLFPAPAGGFVPLLVPQLSTALRSVIDRRPFSFESARRKPPPQLTPPLREELDAFVKRMFRELREVELALLMDRLKTSLAEGAGHPD